MRLSQHPRNKPRSLDPMRNYFLDFPLGFESRVIDIEELVQRLN